jgi:hypothetical protein
MGLAGAGYYFFSKTRQVPIVETKPLTLNKIIDQQIISPTGTPGKNLIWFADSSGHLFSANTNGQGLSEYPLPSPGLEDLDKILWPVSGQNFIFQGKKDKNILYEFYDYSQKKFTVLPNNILQLDWMPDSQRVVMIWKSGDGKSQQLVMSNADGSGYHIVANLPWPEFNLKVSPAGSEALLTSTKAANGNKIYLFNLVEGSYKALISSGNNLDALWLNTNQILFTRLADPYPQLFLYDLSQEKEVDLEINAKLDRVVFDSTADFLYAAVVDPISFDKIIKVNLGNLDKTDFFKPTEPLRVKQLFRINNELMFTSATDGKLYSIK